MLNTKRMRIISLTKNKNKTKQNTRTKTIRLSPPPTLTAHVYTLPDGQKESVVSRDRCSEGSAMGIKAVAVIGIYVVEDDRTARGHGEPTCGAVSVESNLRSGSFWN